MSKEEVNEFEEPVEKLSGEPIDFEDELADFMMQEKLDRMNQAFKDPVYQRQYERLLGDEEELLSLDSVIAMAKVRYSHTIRQNTKNMEVAGLLRGITEAIDRAVQLRERHQEYIHLEQLLWTMQKIGEIVEDEVKEQETARRINKRMGMIQLPRRDQIPIETKATARALAEGRNIE